MSSATRSRSRPRPALSVLGAITLASALVATAIADEPWIFPPPITTEFLVRSMDWHIGSDPDHWPETLDAIEAYQAQYASLRAGEMQQTFELLETLDQEFPPLRSVEDLFRRIDRVRMRMRELDDRFFNRVAPEFDDDRLAGLRRVAAARERQRHMTAFTQWLGAPTTDLSVVAMSLGLDSESRAAIDPILADYEIALTQRLATMTTQSHRAIIAVFAEAEARGLHDPALVDDQEAAAAMHSAFVELQSSGFAPIRHAAHEIAQINHRTHATLIAALPEADAASLTNAFLERAYPHDGRFRDKPAEHARRIVARLPPESLADPAIRHAVDALLREHAATEMRLVDRLLRLKDREMLLVGQMAPVPQDAVRELEAIAEESGTVMQERSDLLEQFRTTLAATVGEDHLRAAVVAAEAESLAAPLVPPDAHHDRFLPPTLPSDLPFAEERLDHWSEWLQLSDGEDAVLRVIHEDHAARWRESVTPLLVEIGELSRQSIAHSVEGLAAIHNSLDRLREALGESEERVAVAHGAFADDLADALGAEDRTAAIRLIRLELAMANIPPRTDRAGRGQDFNPVVVLMGDDRSPEVATVIRDVLLAADRTLRDATRRLTRSRDELALASLAGTAITMPPVRDQVDAGARKAAIERHEQADAALANALQSRAAAVGAMMETLRRRLPEADIWRLEFDLARAVEPWIYDGPNSPLSAIERAMRLPTLADVQRATLATLHEASMRRLLDARIELRNAGERLERLLHARESETALAAASIQHTLAEFRFRETGSRDFVRLRAILTDEQRPTVPELAAFERRLETADSPWR